MKHLRGRIVLLTLFSLVLFLAPFTLSPADLPEIEALAPVELAAQGFKEPTGVVVDQNGAIFVSDRKSGEVLEINTGAVNPIITGLQRPAGLSFDGEGRLLVVEEKTGFLLRLEQDNGLTVLAQGMKEPRWVTVAEDGTIYLSAKGLKSEEDKEKDDDDKAQGQVIVRLALNGQLSLFASGFKGLQGLAVQGQALFAVAEGLTGAGEEEDDHGGVFQIPLLADGSAGAVARLSQSRMEEPVGIVLDALGALYVDAEEMELQEEVEGAIGKIAAGGATTRFASKLKKPRGMAFDSLGNLYVADSEGGEHGRIIRMRAPPPPSLVFPSFTNQNPITIQGTTDPQSRIDALLNNTVLPPTFTDGGFSLLLDLHPNAQNSLAVFSTAHNGQGLTSAPAEAAIVHDNIPPLITNLEPSGGSYLNTNRPLIRADFSDNLSGVDISKVQIQLDGNNVTPLAQISASGFSLDPSNPLSVKLFPLAEGSRTVSVTIFDRAGNSTSASTNFTVDITPPDTQIVSGPEGTISATSAAFTFAGTDNLTPAQELQFSWHLDGAPFSPFSSQTQISFTGLTPGPHTFEVKARDLAGNEDPTPAQRTFTVSLLTVKITDPADGATVPAGSLLVRGSVEAGGQEVGVSVNGFPAAVQGNSFAALVSVTPDTTTLTAVAATAAGATASQSVTVSVLAAPPPMVTLLVSPQSGIAPLTVTFSLLGGPAAASVSLDFDGDGTADFTGTSLDGQTFTYTQPGLYVPRATITDTLGNQFTASALVQVLDRAALDVMLQAKWNGMKDALRNGDIPAALTFITGRSRAKYDEAFQIIAARLPGIDAILTDLTLMKVREASAVYEASRTDNGLPMSFEVRFALDEDGIWRIEAF